MNVQEVGHIEQYLLERTGETRGLSDWCKDINNERMIRRRLTKRELAFIINRHLKNGPLHIERRTNPLQYTFL